MRLLKGRHAVAAPGASINASNFFELAVATAIALFGLWDQERDWQRWPGS